MSVIQNAHNLSLAAGTTAITQAAGDNTTLVATDAFVTGAIATAVAQVNAGDAVDFRTTAASDTSGLSYLNGVSGVGATFTGSINTPFTADGQTATLGQEVLIANDTQTTGGASAGAFNGIYLVTQVQTIALPPILTRATDYDQPSEINNLGQIFVKMGTANAGKSYVLAAKITTVGTNAINYNLSSNAAANTPTLNGNNTFSGTNNFTSAFQLSGNTFATGGALTFANLTTTNDLLYVTSSGNVGQLATANNGTLITSGGGVPSISSTLPTVVQANITSTGSLASGSLTTGFTKVNVAQGGTGDTSFTAYAPIFGGITTTGALQSGTVGTTGQALTSNGAGALPTFQTAVIPGYIQGGNISYDGSGGINIGPLNGPAIAGYAADSTGAVMMPIYNASGFIGGNTDQFSGPGTVTTSTSNATVTGNASATFLTSFFPGGTPLAGAGTISSSSATVTGTSTYFLTQVAVGDLIGNTTSGYFSVTAVKSNTSITINAAPGTPFSGSAFNIIENPTIQVSSDTPQQVIAIASNTSLTLSSDNSATHASGVTYQIGVVANNTNIGSTNNMFMFLWNGQGASGVTNWFSTQRTTPFTVSGYSTYVRRIASVLFSAGNILPFTQWGGSNDRWYNYNIANTTFSSRILSAGTATTRTLVSAAALAPATATALRLKVIASSDPNGQAYVITPNLPGDTTTSNTFAQLSQSGSDQSTANFEMPCDGAQNIIYLNTSASLDTYIDVGGYMESL